MNRVLRFVLAAVLACSALMLTACQGSPSGSNDKKTYKIGVLRIDDSLPLYTAETENSLPNTVSTSRSLNSAPLRTSKKPWKPVNWTA